MKKFIPSINDKINYQPDIILVTGDAYVDHASFGIAIIARYLQKFGYKVAVIGQPDLKSGKDIIYFGEPKLFWGVTAGCLDSITANYTALHKKIKNDVYTPGNQWGKRPDRATIIYTNLIRRYFKNQIIVLGGLEASLRRLAHYDWQQDKIRKSVLLDSKADYLVYGMGEKTVVEIADKIKNNKIDEIKSIRGICYRTNEFVDIINGLKLPEFDIIKNDKNKFLEFFKLFDSNNDPFTSKKLFQKFGNMYVVQNQPQFPLSSDELDEVYELPYTREVHPYYKKLGKVKSIESVRNSIVSHRGCYGNCSFCSITAHQGNIVISRTENSILKEVYELTKNKSFHGTITDIGGPTANMYGIECNKKLQSGNCIDKQCLYPEPCNSLNINHNRYINLLKKVSQIKKVKHVFVSSGIRYDMILKDENCEHILKKIINKHTSGRMKIAPEHTDKKILGLMNKPDIKKLEQFLDLFYKLNKSKVSTVYYFICGHPGADFNTEKKSAIYCKSKLKIQPELIQIFTPTPSTWSTAMYYTGLDKNGNKLFVEKNLRNKKKMKNKTLGI